MRNVIFCMFKKYMAISSISLVLGDNIVLQIFVKAILAKVQIDTNKYKHARIDNQTIDTMGCFG